MGEKYSHVRAHIRMKSKPSKKEEKRLKDEKEKKLRSEYNYRVKIGANRNLSYEEWKKWYLHNE